MKAYIKTAKLADSKGYKLSDLSNGRTKMRQPIMLSKLGDSPRWFADFKKATEFLNNLEAE